MRTDPLQHSVLVRALDEIPIRGYGLMLMIGFLLSIMWAARRAERSGANPDVVLNCGFIALLGGVVGARTMYVVHYWNEQFAPARQHRTGRSSRARRARWRTEVYGGLITVVVLVFLYLYLGKHSIRWYLDIVAPSHARHGHRPHRLPAQRLLLRRRLRFPPWAVRFPYGSPAEVQHWGECRPGAGLPQELLVFTNESISLGGTTATPLPRSLDVLHERA